MFDGSLNALGHGIGTILTSPKNIHLPFTTRLCFEFINNIVKYEAFIMGIEVAIDLRIKILEVYEDYSLVINRVKG